MVMGVSSCDLGCRSTGDLHRGRSGRRLAVNVLGHGPSGAPPSASHRSGDPPPGLLPFVQAHPRRPAHDAAMAIDITKVPIHLGPGGTANAIEDFDWSAERLAAYDRRREPTVPTDAW